MHVRNMQVKIVASIGAAAVEDLTSVPVDVPGPFCSARRAVVN